MIAVKSYNFVSYSMIDLCVSRSGGLTLAFASASQFIGIVAAIDAAVSTSSRIISRLHNRNDENGIGTGCSKSSLEVGKMLDNAWVDKSAIDRSEA